MQRVAPATQVSWMPILINGAMFNLSWLVIVLTESSVLAVAQVALHLCVHFMLMGRGWPEAKLIAQVTIGGLILDQLLFATGVFNLRGQAALAPLWLSCLWPVFATTLAHAFAGFGRHLGLAAAVGAVSGTASYIAGVRLTEVAFGSTLWGPALLACLWALLFPALLRWAAGLGLSQDDLRLR